MPERSGFITLLRWFEACLPGDYLKTLFYLNAIQKPRTFLRLSLNSFYRMDHIYSVLAECRGEGYQGAFSILEFGVADGYAFTKMLYATRFMKMDSRVTVHGFDCFEGLPKSGDPADQDLVTHDGYVTGQYRGDFEALQAHCGQRYSNYAFHEGRFEETLTPELLETFRVQLPILIWIDCDYYTSSKAIFQRLIPYIPTGCVLYFDDYDFNFGSRFTGEARAVHEINHGLFGPGIELIRDDHLSLNSNRVYRFINLNCQQHYERPHVRNRPDDVHRRTNDSPMP